MWTIRDAIGLIVEPAGAVGVAGALAHRLPGATQATIVTGSNISAELLRTLAPEPR